MSRPLGVAFIAPSVTTYINLNPGRCFKWTFYPKARHNNGKTSLSFSFRLPCLLCGRELHDQLPDGAGPRDVHPQPHRGQPETRNGGNPRERSQVEPVVPGHQGLRSGQPLPSWLRQTDSDLHQGWPGLPEVLVLWAQRTCVRALHGLVQNHAAVPPAKRAQWRAGAVWPHWWFNWKLA